MKTKKKLEYDNIKLGGHVIMPCTSDYSPNHIGKIVCIDNLSLQEGIDEPIFHVQCRDYKAYFGLKYILKYYINE